MRLLAVVAALTLAVAAPVAGAPSLASSGVAATPGRADRAAAAPALLPGVGRRSFTTEPSLPPATGQPTAPASSARAPDPAGTEGPAGPGSSALLPQILTAVLGLVTAALAFREVAHRTRRPTPGRHLRTEAPSDPAPGADPAPSDRPGPDPAPARRP